MTSNTDYHSHSRVFICWMFLSAHRPRMDSCEHLEKRDGICINCGYCTEDYLGEEHLVFQPSFRLTPPLASDSNSKHFRCSGNSNDPLYKYKVAADKTLVPLGLNCYRECVIKLARESKFLHKVNNEDRVLLSLYRFCKLTGCPIDISDILQYTRLAKSRFLKIYRAAFQYAEASADYLRGIFDRSRRRLEDPCSQQSDASTTPSHPTTNNSEFQAFRRLSNANVTVNPVVLSMACILLRKDKISRRRILKEMEVGFRRKVSRVVNRLETA